MQKIFIFILILLQAGCTLSNTPHITELEEQAKKEASHVGVIHKDVVYKETLLYTPVLDIYEPLIRKTEPSPLYIYIHGGSWLHGDKELVNVYAKTVQGLREEGITVVSINYRYVTQAGIEAMIEDCIDAVKFMQVNAAKYNIDPHTIGLHGHSAGGNLALVTGLTLSRNSNDIRFIVDEYGPTDVVRLLDEKEDRPWWTSMISDKTLYELSPITMIHPNMPPIYITHGDADKTVPITQSIVFYEKLKADGARVVFERVSGADHGYEGIDEARITQHRTKVLSFMLQEFKR